MDVMSGSQVGGDVGMRFHTMRGKDAHEEEQSNVAANYVSAE
jgi:hypothetical protein